MQLKQICLLLIDDTRLVSIHAHLPIDDTRLPSTHAHLHHGADSAQIALHQLRFPACNAWIALIWGLLRMWMILTLVFHIADLNITATVTQVGRKSMSCFKIEIESNVLQDFLISMQDESNVLQDFLISMQDENNSKYQLMQWRQLSQSVQWRPLGQRMFAHPSSAWSANVNPPCHWGSKH